MKYEQGQNNFNAFKSIEGWDHEAYVMISEFIDNSISQHEYSNQNNLKIKFHMNYDDKSLTYSDNAGGVTHYPDSNQKYGKAILDNEGDINKIFKFYSSGVSKGLNKYHVGMKQAIYFMCKSWEFTSPFPNIGKSYKASASIKEKPDNEDGKISLSIDPIDSKLNGVEIKMFDFTQLQLDRIFDFEAFEFSTWKNTKKKNRIIPIIAEKYKYIFSLKNMTVEFMITWNGEIKSKTLDKETIKEYCIQPRFDNVEPYSKEDWNKKYEIILEKKAYLKLKFNKLNKNNATIASVNLIKKTPTNIFLEKLINREPLVENFEFKNGVYLRIGIMDLSYKFITASSHQGLTYFQHSRGIWIRPHKKQMLFSNTRGGGDTHIFVEAHVPDSVMQPDQNKKGFANKEIQNIIKTNAESIIHSTSLRDVAQYLVYFKDYAKNKNQPKELKSSIKHESHLSSNERFAIDLKNNIYQTFKNNILIEEKTTKILDNPNEIYMVKQKGNLIEWNKNNFLEQLHLKPRTHEKATLVVGSVVGKHLLEEIEQIIDNNVPIESIERLKIIHLISKKFDEILGNNNEKNNR